MRVPVICLAVLVAVFLALPETTGAPTNPGSESYKRQEEKSKKVAKEGEEQENYYESTRNANGLVSGSKAHSLDKRNSELEEEQSSSEEEIKTATGLKKTKRAKRQKKVVTSSEHKEVLVYYMVSYKTLPKQRSGECRIAYYKRIFPIEDNLKEFYHKIFKNYETEDSKQYIERVEFILNNVYPDYDPRLDVKWLEEFDHYYTLKYSRKVDECDESYFPRVLAKESGESCEHYKKRMECLIAALDEEDFTHITFDDSELGYKIGVRTAKARSTSAGSSEGRQISSQVNTSTQKSKEEEESVDESETTVEREGQSGSSKASKKEVKKKRTTVEKEINSKSSTFRMAYNKLPAKEDGESLIDYYKRYFGECSRGTLTEEAIEENLLRFVIQYRGETTEEYIKRVDFIFDNVYTDLDIRGDATYANLLSHYYRSKYTRKSTETEEQWCARVLKKYEGESTEQYKQRVTCLKAAFTDFDWSKITIDENSSEGYTLVSRGSSSSSRSVSKSLSEEEVLKTYFKAEEEDTTTYINRISKELATIQNINELTNIVQALIKKYPNSLWYDAKYVDFFKTYYTKIYEKTSIETEEDYHKRILTKQSFETDEIYVNRMELLQKLYPTLSIWSDDTYYDKYMKACYVNVYKKLSDEDDATYYARLLSKCDEESDFAYVTRLNLIKKTYPDLLLWYDNKYFSKLKKYYVSLYEKKTVETDEVYFKRLFTKEAFETEETYYKRLEVVQKLFPTISVWSDDKYYETWVKAYIQYVYKKSSCEDETTYYSRLISKFDDESDVEYVNRLTLIRRAYPELTLWYDCNSKYYELVKKYYIVKYAKLSSETEEEHYKRFVAKESCESDDIYVKRMQILQKLYPTISIWSDVDYYKYTKECYQKIYKQLDTEDKEKYFSRVVSRWEGESDATYTARLALIQRTYRCLSLWYSEKYYDLVKEFYTIRYAQQAGESNADYIKRLTKKEKGDSTDSIYGKRIHLIHLATISSAVWYEDQYYDCCTKSYYASYYKKGDDEKCAEWLKRVFTLLSGESECNAIKRIALIKKSTNYSCWTLEILSEIESCFAEAYITTIKETFFASISSYSSSSSSSKKSTSEESEEEDFVLVSRG